jgi:hypothetical protein
MTAWSLFAQGGYRFASGDSGTNPSRRESVKGDIGVQFAW